MSKSTTQATTKATKNPPPPKADSKSKTSTAAKKAEAKKSNGKADKAKAKAVEADVEPEMPDLPEKDVKTSLKEINALILKAEETKTSSSWGVGKLLHALRDRTPTGQFNRICKERVIDAEGKAKSRSWCAKVVRMYSLRPKDEALAVKVGLAKLDSIVRLPEEARNDVMHNGFEIEDDNGKDIRVFAQDLSVGEVKDLVIQYLIQLGEITEPTAQESAVNDIQKIVKALNAFNDNHSGTLKKKKFESVQRETIEGCLTSIGDFTKQFVLPEEKAARKKK